MYLHAESDGPDSGFMEKSEVAKKIEDLTATRYSKFHQNQSRKQDRINQRIDALKERLIEVRGTSELERCLRFADSLILGFETTRCLDRYIAHVDMDAFYASVEEHWNPALKNVPMAVGDQSMLCTANYEARNYGVRSAMPGFMGKELCPNLVLVKPDFERYRAASAIVQQVFSMYDPDFDMMSLDEGYLDLSKYIETNKVTPQEALEALREHIYAKTSLTASGAIAPNRLLAKVCSDINKPNGQFILGNDRRDVLEFVKDLRVSKVSGIGKVTEQILKQVLGVKTCSQLFDKRAEVVALFSKTASEFLLRVCIGVGSSQVGGEWNRKSISVERTFEPTSDRVVLFSKLKEISEKLIEDLREEGISGKTLTLKLKTDEFEIRSRAKTVANWLNMDSDIFTLASGILNQEMPVKLRLIGLRLSSLSDEQSTRQPSDITKYFKPKQKTDEIDPEMREEFSCPICGNYIQEVADERSNLKLNQHIDLCLNKSTISTIKNQSSSSVSVVEIDDSDDDIIEIIDCPPRRGSEGGANVQIKSKSGKPKENGSVLFMKKFLSQKR